MSIQHAKNQQDMPFHTLVLVFASLKLTDGLVIKGLFKASQSELGYMSLFPAGY